MFMMELPISVVPPSADPDGQPTSDATGDDNASNDDG